MAKKIYIGAEKQFTITNLLGACDDVGNRGAGEVIFVNNSIFKTGSQSWIFIPSSDATEVTYMLRQNASTLIKPHLIPSHKYYFSAWLQQLTPSFGQGSFDFYWPVQEPVFLSGAKPDKANEWCLVSAIKERSSFAEGDYECRVDWNDAKANLGMFFDGLTLVDLTAAFGAGNEPDQAWCDANIPFTKTTATVSRGTAHNVKNMFIGVDGKARKVKKAYIGVGEKARLFYTSTLPPALVEVWRSGATNTAIECIAYANGYWVVGGMYISGSTSYARIAYATSVNGPWTIKDLWSGKSSHNTIQCITYANGYWVVGGEKYTTGDYYSRIAYATSPDGTWTTKDVWSGGGIPTQITCAAYANGYWVVGGMYRSGSSSTRYVEIAYTTDLSGAWTEKTIWSSGSSYTAEAAGIAYANGYWVVGGTYKNSSDSFGRIAYATSPGGTWTTKDVWGGNGINRITYANGYWIVCGRSYATSTSDARIAYATSPGGTWTTKDVWSGIQTTCAYGATYADGHWVVYGKQHENSAYYARIAYATSLNGPWTTKDVQSSSNNDDLICDMAYDGTYWMAAVSSDYTASIAYSADLSEFDQI